MNKDLKYYLLYRVIMTVFYFMVLLTMFMPMFAIDEYVEYQFHELEYSSDYTSHSRPLAKKITPLQLMQNLWTKDEDIEIITDNYEIYEAQCQDLYSRGLISKLEFDQLLAEGEETNRYYVATIYNGCAEYARIQDKVKLISIITIVLYGLAGLFFIFNVFNLLLNAKVLYIINGQSSWIYAGGTLVFIIYVFATSLTNYNHLEKNNAVLETTMTCLSVNGLFIFLLVLEIIYAVFSLIISAKFNKNYQRVYEVPDFVTEKVQATTIVRKKRRNYIPAEIVNKSNSNQAKKGNSKKKKKKRKKNGKK